jgi:hypothetical protein
MRVVPSKSPLGAAWQVYLDTNLAIREVLGDGAFPAPMPVYGIQQMSQAAHA